MNEQRSTVEHELNRPQLADGENIFYIHERQHARQSLLVDLFIDVEGNTSILDSIELTFLYDSIGEPTSRMTVRTFDTRRGFLKLYIPLCMYLEDCSWDECSCERD